MAPIKIKLSLSSTAVQPSSESPVPAKGKGKDTAATITPVPTTKTVDTPSRTTQVDTPSRTTQVDKHIADSRDSAASSAGPSRIPYTAPEQNGSGRCPSAAGLANSPVLYDTPTRPSKSTKAKGSSSRPVGRPKGSKTKRPSAIPTRLLSSAPSTPKPATSLPLIDTPSPGRDDSIVKIEESEDGSLAYGSPSTPRAEDDPTDTPGSGDYATPQTADYGTPTTGQKQSARWMKIKRPMRELGTKIIADLVRRDDYDLFGEPVDLEAYPDYLQIVGGEDKMMDLGTMQNKLDNEEYPSFAEFQADLEKLVTAAKRFNPAGTVPHNAAVKLFNQGMKQIERSRDLVATPPPSRAGSRSRWRDGSAQSGREMTAMTEDGQDGGPRKNEILPPSYVPEEMLDYPANSTAAKLVGWNLNGGKRVYAKRVTRGREKFVGKWRHWDLDGSRDVAEMDDPDYLFELSKSRRGESLRSVTDWMKMRREAWWEHESMGGPNGQPPLPGTAPPRRVEMKEKEIMPTDLGVYRDISFELQLRPLRGGGPDEQAMLLAQLNLPPRRTTAPGPSNFTNIFERPLGRQPKDYVRDLQTGDPIGEAYMRSVERFVRGAVAGRTSDAAVKREDRAEPQSERENLERWILDHSGSGVLRPTTELRTTVKNTLESLDRLRPILAAGQEVPADLEWVYTKAKEAYSRAALHALTDNANSLEIAPLIRQPTEFQWTGIGGKGDIPIGLRWVSERMAAHNERIKGQSKSKKRSLSNNGMDIDIDPDVKRLKVEENGATASRGSSPLSAAPDSPTKPDVPPTANPTNGVMSPTTFDSPTDYDDGEGGLKRVRLELLALTKFYPLAALRKMDKASAAKLLPANVQALMTKP